MSNHNKNNNEEWIWFILGVVSVAFICGYFGVGL